MLFRLLTSVASSLAGHYAGVVVAVKAGGREDAERRTGDFRAAVRRAALHRDARHRAPLAGDGAGALQGGN
jgi:hypothetical protein